MSDLKSQKQKANKLISSKLRDILQEVTEVEDVDGQPVMVSKAEKLARTMMRMALGYRESIERKLNGQTVVDEIVHGPNAGMMALVMDRLEGRIPLASPEEPDKRTLSDRVSEQARNRINSLSAVKEKPAGNP